MIDAHVHFWNPERGDYGWLTPELGAIYRPILPDELAPLISAGDVQGVIAVQAAPTEEETRFLFGLATEYPFILGVVGWVDLAAADAASRIARLAADGGGLLKGLRPMLEIMADPDWAGRPELDAGFGEIAACDLVLDALVRIHHLPALARRIERTPALRVVIDHGAKPDIGGDRFDEWTTALAPFADRPGVSCKLSGLLTETGPRESTAADRYARWLIDAFGPDRLIWGSDWPVLNLVSDYASWLRQARRLVGDPRVFDLNARKVYRLDRAVGVIILQATDNVGVALRDVVEGETVASGVIATEAIDFGFKVAIRAIAEREKILKYGVSIGSATRAIAPGERVHLENMRSDYTATHTRDLKEKNR